MKIGFIGLGRMGKNMARNLIKKNYSLKVFDINHEPYPYFQELGADIAISPNDLATECNVIITMLPNEVIVEKVIIGENGLIQGVKPGTIIIDMSSSSPIVTKKISKLLAEKEVVLIDAPVSGGLKSAEEATLTIMIGGDTEHVHKITNILEAMGKKLIHVGEIGSGHLVKAFNNMITATSFLITSEAMIAGNKYGVEPVKMLEAINSSTGRTYASECRFTSVLENDFHVRFTNELLYKDIGIAMEIANEIDSPTFLGSFVHNFWRTIISQHGGQEDFSTAIKYFERLANFEMAKTEP